MKSRQARRPRAMTGDWAVTLFAIVCVLVLVLLAADPTVVDPMVRVVRR
jgi:hypothetical protein